MSFWIKALFFCVFFAASMRSTAQEIPVIGNEKFESIYILPSYFSDEHDTVEVTDLITGNFDGQLIPLRSPYLSFKQSEGPWWLRVQLKYEPVDTNSKRRTLVLFFARRTVDRITVWNGTPPRPVFIDTLGPRFHKQDTFALTNGYYAPLTLTRGLNTFWIKMDNESGRIQTSLMVYSPNGFAVQNRRNVMWFGLFVGVIIFSILLTILLYYIYRDRLFLSYIFYIMAVSARELYNFSLGLTLEPSAMRHVITFYIGGAFALFLYHFLQVGNWKRWINQILWFYFYSMLAGSLLYAGFIWFKKFNAASNVLIISMGYHLFFVPFALFETLVRYKTDIRARVVVFAYAPIAAAFFLNILRTLNFIPNYYFMQYAIMGGVILEIVVLTIAFMGLHRSLQEQLESEKLTKKQEIQEAEQRVKDQVARDLHDDVAASLSGIRILSGVAREKLKKPGANVTDLLSQIGANAESSLESIGDLIWAVQYHKDYLNDMADRMRGYAVNVLDAKDIDYRLDIPRNLPIVELATIVRRNIYLIFKEATHNALRHSHCKQMYIGLKASGDVMTLTVKDDGKGLPEDLGANRGLGLDSMRRRAQEIGADFQLRSSANEGVTVTLIYKLPEPGTNS